MVPSQYGCFLSSPLIGGEMAGAGSGVSGHGDLGQHPGCDVNCDFKYLPFSHHTYKVIQPQPLRYI